MSTYAPPSMSAAVVKGARSAAITPRALVHSHPNPQPAAQIPPAPFLHSLLLPGLWQQTGRPSYRCQSCWPASGSNVQRSLRAAEKTRRPPQPLPHRARPHRPRPPPPAQHKWRPWPRCPEVTNTTAFKGPRREAPWGLWDGWPCGPFFGLYPSNGHSRAIFTLLQNTKID